MFNDMTHASQLLLSSYFLTRCFLALRAILASSWLSSFVSAVTLLLDVGLLDTSPACSALSLRFFLRKRRFCDRESRLGAPSLPAPMPMPAPAPARLEQRSNNATKNPLVLSWYGSTRTRHSSCCLVNPLALVSPLLGQAGKAETRRKFAFLFSSDCRACSTTCSFSCWCTEQVEYAILFTCGKVMACVKAFCWNSCRDFNRSESSWLWTRVFELPLALATAASVLYWYQWLWLWKSGEE